MTTKPSLRNVALALAPVAAGMGFLGLGAQPAGAAEVDNLLNVSFVDNEGATWHCQIFGDQSYDSTAKQLNVVVIASEGGTGEDQAGCIVQPVALPQFEPNSSLEMDTTFSQSSDGTQVEETTAGSIESSATFTGVQNAKITTTYTVKFTDCNSNLSQCDYSFSLSQGK